MICKICGYNSEEPIGTALESGMDIKIELNDNGKKGFFCIMNHFRDKMSVEVKKQDDNIIRMVV